MKLYKFFNENMKHYELQYREGLNTLPPGEEFDPDTGCTPGGIYFASEEIFQFITYGPWISEIEIPPNAKVSYGNTKHKADKVIVKKFRKFDEEVIDELVAQGANTHNAAGGELIRWFIRTKDANLSNRSLITALFEEYHYALYTATVNSSYNMPKERDHLTNIINHLLNPPNYKVMTFLSRLMCEEALCNYKNFTNMFMAFVQHLDKQSIREIYGLAVKNRKHAFVKAMWNKYKHEFMSGDRDEKND
ncbi:MAG TPA: hypothetical protein P5539_12325 [Mesotoga sp.]|nr:hypothetical protein [Mesotoga sp.]